MHLRLCLMDTNKLECDLIQCKLLQHRTLQCMDLGICFEYMLYSLGNQNFQYILVDILHMDFHDNREHIHKLLVQFQIDNGHYYRMAMVHKHQMFVALLEELK